MIRDQRGYTFFELMGVMVILGVLAAASITAIRSSTPVIVGRMVQVAMVNLAAEQPQMKYPAAVTIDNLKSYGAGALLDDYIINSYTRTGTPAGKDYKLELKAPDTALICITEATLTKTACS